MPPTFLPRSLPRTSPAGTCRCYLPPPARRHVQYLHRRAAAHAPAFHFAHLTACLPASRWDDGPLPPTFSAGVTGGTTRAAATTAPAWRHHHYRPTFPASLQTWQTFTWQVPYSGWKSGMPATAPVPKHRPLPCLLLHSPRLPDWRVASTLPYAHTAAATYGTCALPLRSYILARRITSAAATRVPYRLPRCHLPAFWVLPYCYALQRAPCTAALPTPA